MNQLSSDKTAGKITVSPNPLPPEAGSPMTIQWEVDGEEGGEICVVENHGPEKLVCLGKRGSVEVDWIKAGTEYAFRLYTRAEPRRMIDAVTVQRIIAGRITATPNPIPFGDESGTRLQWEITHPAKAEIYVSEAGSEERLVCRGANGSLEIKSLKPGVDYVFTLCTASEPRRMLDSIIVRNEAIPWSKLLEALQACPNWEDKYFAEIGRFIGEIAPRLLYHPRFRELFQLWEKRGLHVTPVHFYQPVPDTRTIPETTWGRQSELAGVDMNDSVQLDLLRNCFPRFRDEYEQLPSAPTGDPTQFHLNNALFAGTDALVTYCMVRHFRPRLIVEVGSGYSSLISGQAAAKNGDSSLICIEPFPVEVLVKGFPGLRSLIKKKVEDIELEFFSQLKAGDILFIDSSHTVRIAGDVNYLFLEVIPRLNPGVIVHVHDIMLPYEYSRAWVMDELRFWTEQYLFQAFLAFNSDFEVLMANNYLAARYLDEFKATFPHSQWWGGGSFWIRRKPTRAATAPAGDASA